MCLSFCELFKVRSSHFYNIFVFKLLLFRLFSCLQRSRWWKVVTFKLMVLNSTFSVVAVMFIFNISKNKSPSFQSPLGDWLMKKERSKAENVLYLLLIWEKNNNKQKIRQFARYDLGRGHWLFRRLLPEQAIRLLIRKLENYCLESPRLAYSLQMLPKYGHLFYWPERSKPKP